MNFQQTQLALITAFDVTTQTQDPVVPFVWGPPGVGKSACALQASVELAERLGLHDVMELGDRRDYPETAFGFIDIRLSQLDAVEIAGFPHPDNELGVMTRMIGDWFPHEGRTDLPEYGIIFLDEWTSAPQLVQAASYQLANDRRLGGHRLKPGWMVVGAGNRMTDGGVVFKQPLPLSNRLAHFDFESDLDGYLAWGAKTGELSPVITSFLRFRPDLLNTFEDHIKEKRQGHAFATERTWHRLSRIVEADLPVEQLRRWAYAYVGESVAVEFMAFCKTWQDMPSISGILKDPKGAKLPQRADTRYAVCGALSSRVDENTWPNAVAYLERVEDEAITTLFFQETMMRNEEIVTGSPEFSKYANKLVNVTLAA